MLVRSCFIEEGETKLRQLLLIIHPVRYPSLMNFESARLSRKQAEHSFYLMTIEHWIPTTGDEF